MSILIPILQRMTVTLDNPADPPSGGVVPFGGNVSASGAIAFGTAAASGGDVGVQKHFVITATHPAGSLTEASANPLWDWGDLEAMTQFSGQVKASFLLYVKDPLLPYPDWAGFDTPRGRPNHLRQIHGRYNLTWFGDLSWAASIEGWYQEIDPGTGEGGPVIPFSDSDSGTTASGDGLILSSAPPALGYGYSWDNGGGIYIPGEPQAAICTIVGVMTVDSAAVEGDLQRFNYDGALEAYDPQTTAQENTVTGYWPASPSGDTYIIWPHWTGQLTGDARIWDASADIVLRGTPSLPPFGGDVRVRPTPYDSGAITETNSTGPSPDDHGPSGVTEPPTHRKVLAYPLDEYGRLHQADYYGRFESLWIAPPETATWLAFKLMRTPTLLVDTCMSTRSGSTVNLGAVSQFDWTAGSGVTMSIAGGYRRAVVSASPSDPALRRNLWDDWQDMAVNPSAYRDAASTPVDIAAYIGARKTWYNIRRRVNSDADVANWGNHRWLKIVGKADSTRTFTLRVSVASAAISDNYRLGMLSTDSGAPDPETDPSVRVIDVTQTGVDVDVAGLSLGTTDTTVYVDLAEVAHQAGTHLSHVTGFEFQALEPGGTYEFKTVHLCSGKSTGVGAVNEFLADWRYWTGIPYADDECVIPVVDGLVCCRQDNLNEGTESPYVLTYIQRMEPVTPPDYSPRSGDETKTLTELREEIGYQEGFQVDESDIPPADFVTWDWALFLDRGWHDATDSYSAYATVKCADMDVPLLTDAIWQAHGWYRGQARGLCLDATQRWTADGRHVQAHGLDSDGLLHSVGSPAVTDDNGSFSLPYLPQAGKGKHETRLDEDRPAGSGYPEGVAEAPRYLSYRFEAADLLDGSAQPVTADAAVSNLSVCGPLLSGEPEEPETGEGVSHYINKAGFLVRALSIGPNVVVQRRTRIGGEIETLATWAGSQPSVHETPDGVIYCAYVSGGSVKLRAVLTGSEAIVATGSKPAYRVGPGGALQALTVWRANAIYITVWDARGNVLHGGERQVVNGVVEQRADVDWHPNGTMEVQYVSGGSTAARFSTDTGYSWS